MPKQTPSQTVGPYLRIVSDLMNRHHIAEAGAEGTHIRIEGQVVDGNHAPVPDALVEVWQANAAGRYDHPDDTHDKPLDPACKGWGRAPTDSEGRFWFETVKPGPVPGRGNVLQAPHLNLTIFARGMLLHAYTRLYFADETAANEVDPVLNAVPPARRGTLVARRDAGNPPVYHLRIVLQGEDETVFFDA
jgi:protocatechuate 3,4-dioxygenase alpha subunit